MTDERKNEIWSMLPSDFKKEAREFLMAYGESSAVLNDVLVALFGFHNLIAQAEEKLLFKSNYKAGDKVVITGSLCENRGKIITLVRQYDCPREANDYQKLWVGQFEDGHTCSIAEKGFTPTVEFEQPEENPKEPRFKVGDKVYVPWLTHKRKAIITEIGTYGYTVIDFENNTLRNFMESELEPYTPQNVKSESESDEQYEKSDSSSQNCTIRTENGISDSKIQSESAESVETSANSQSVNHIPDTAKKVDYSQYRLDLAKEIAVAMIKSECDWDVSNCAVSYANEIVKRLKETEE